MSDRAVLLVHGGAGVVSEDEMTPEKEAAFRKALAAALGAGYDVLRTPSGSSLDAVEAAIRVLEDSPLFNAGKGSVFNRDGRHEMDAALMEGKSLRAGAVAAVTRVRNPITAARAVLDASGHVLLVGEGADRFAGEQGLVEAGPEYFWTEHRWKSFQADRDRREGRAAEPGRFGTVGAVAIDRDGTLAAGASTGGMNGKHPGRVGDTPLVGAGVYAENGVAAVSCTGDGEGFIRVAAAHEVVALMKYARLSVAEAAARVVPGAIDRVDAEGGLIALGADGRFALPFNSEGMYRGVITEGGEARVAIRPGGLTAEPR